MVYRIRYIAVSVIAIFIFVIPFMASADRQSDILQEIAEIFTQIQQLQAQLDAISRGSGTGATNPTNTTPTTTSNCPLIRRSLGLGSSGSDVTNLQQYLAQDPNIYPEGIVSGYFGTLTEKALQRWQAAHGIVSSGSPETTGYGAVGPRTRNALQNCGDSVPSSFGALINVSPTSGEVPLAVNARVTVNTSNSCSRATYNLDFGDGTAPVKVNVPENHCQEMLQNIGHTYSNVGSYNVSLGIGNNRTSIPVTVRERFNFNIPTITPSVGPAPLTVQIQATFETQSCSSLPHEFQTFRVNFGDGTSEDVYVHNASNVPTDCGKSITKSLPHKYSTNGQYTVVLEEVGPDVTGAATVVNTDEIGTVDVSATGTGITIEPFSVSPESGTVPLTVLAKFSHGLCREAESWRLDWGDGIQHEETLIRDTSSGVACSAVSANRSFYHTFAQPGNYQVSLYKGGGSINTAPLFGSKNISVSQ